MKTDRINLIIFIFILAIYITGQFLIGTYNPSDGKFYYDKPADVDFLYYGAITNQVMNHFPPQNPALAGENLTQPFLQYYPTALLAKLFNPYNSIRIMNVVYLLILGYLLRRYFPASYSFGLAIMFVSSSLFVDLNALGVDLIARGFTHAPFFILLTIALWGKNIKYRLLAIFVAPMINGYMMLMVLPALGIYWLIDRNRHSLFILLAAVAGMVIASLYISTGTVDKPFYFIFSESFQFAPGETFLHALPFIIFAFFYRNYRASIILAIAVIFGSLIHYNPFFPIFLIYFSGAMMLLKNKVQAKNITILKYAILSLLFILFVYKAFNKYDPNNGGYYPRFDSRLSASNEWIENNTDDDDIFVAISSGGNELALIMENHPVYLGFIGHLAHLGYGWKKRQDNMVRLYNGGIKIENCNYIYYGPVEKSYFPVIHLPFPIAYQDSIVTIFKL